MKHFFMRFQLILVSAVLLLTLGIMMALVMKYNVRWDFTKEKLYSLTQPTVDLLKQLGDKKLEVLAFYPHDDRARESFELFLKQCQLRHPKLVYNFYDPDRIPSLAKKYHITAPYTVIVRYGDLQERIPSVSEENFTNALLRLARPRQMTVCFTATHGEPSVSVENREGMSLLARSLEENNYKVTDALLKESKETSSCQIFVIAGPHNEMDSDELDYLKKVFNRGGGILFLIDPMDPGQGISFVNFMADMGVTLGQDVVVDKMSKLVGGDFLVPLVSQYVVDHPITAKFNKPTFFPVARGVNPSTSAPAGLEVVPLALTSTGSWAETNLEVLEKGEANYEAETDLPGPISLAVAVARKPPQSPQTKEEPTLAAETGKTVEAGKVPEASQPGTGKDSNASLGRMVVVGDSDFVTNAYFDLSGNSDLVVNMIQWLVKDDRFISIRPREPEFKPLFLNERKQVITLLVSLASLPVLFLLIGATRVVLRKRSL